MNNFGFLTAHLLPKTKTRELDQASELVFLFVLFRLYSHTNPNHAGCMALLSYFTLSYLICFNVRHVILYVICYMLLYTYVIIYHTLLFGSPSAVELHVYYTVMRCLCEMWHAKVVTFTVTAGSLCLQTVEALLPEVLTQWDLQF